MSPISTRDGSLAQSLQGGGRRLN
ncbi:hypothetical protein CGRA01v4_08043 [Colletotrichum graminicola]|nr:hypothetical protein CGRA01v4_08043 [Colletotrichum graminicola]